MSFWDTQKYNEQLWEPLIQLSGTPNNNFWTIYDHYPLTLIYSQQFSW